MCPPLTSFLLVQPLYASGDLISMMAISGPSIFLSNSSELICLKLISFIILIRLMQYLTELYFTKNQAREIK